MNNCLITVIVPVFNEEKFIDRCMKSLENQTWKILQIILVDGGSTDSSPQICDEWAKKWNRHNTGIVEVIHTSNRGVSASRNKGINHASGEYILFVDGDDWLEPNAIELLYKSLTENDADVSGCEFQSRYDAGMDIDETRNSADINDESQTGDRSENACVVKSAYNFISKNMLHGDLHCWGRLYKKSIMGPLRFREGLTIGEDMLFLLEYVMKCEKVVSIDNKCYNYYRNPAGVMTRPFTEHTMDQVKCWIEMKDILLQSGNADLEALSSSADLYGNILIAIMLTASRLATIDKKIRKDDEYRNYARQLRDDIKAYKNRQSMKMVKTIPGGYPLKITLFRACPALYLSLYHMIKS